MVLRMETLLYYLIAINVVTFLIYGIDKWKAKRSSWRISEATLLILAVIGGSIGALLGMKVWHHKTQHKKFKYGLPLILLAQIALIGLTSCKTKQTIELSAPIESHKYEPEHSPNVFLVMYDKEIGKEPLLKAIKEYGVEIIYDYGMISGMALKKPENKTLEETMKHFKQVKGVTNVEYDHIIRLTDPVKPRFEIK
jgi:uncharacterized membrane protein YsdA (DUF1294 family)